MKGEVSAALALALGLPVDARSFSWAAAFAVARRERCAPLAWGRSHATIRELAPGEVAAAWRAEALSAASLAEFWETLLCDTVGALREAGVDVVVLKGLPLAARLYGDTHLRPSSDLDLFVPAEQRVVADSALNKLGWKRCRGEPPNESVYRIERGERAALLEVHSALLDDDLVAHLSFGPPGWQGVLIGQQTIPAHYDAQLAGFLAAHLAKHALPPLLWFIDFDTLWTALGAEDKRRAWEAARVARVHRYLAWAIRRASDIRLCAVGDDNALERLGIGEHYRSERHSALRVAALAANPRDAALVVKGWLVPGWVRNGRQASVLSAQRAAKLLRRGIRFRAAPPRFDARGVSAAQDPRRGVTLTPSDLNAILEHLAQRDAEFSIRATGRSMNPSIMPGMTVSLIPRGQRPVRVGDVVLAKTAGDRCVLHRVVALHAGFVEMQGDANAIKDSPVASSSVLAIATGIVFDGVVQPIPRSRWIRALRRARWLLTAPSRGGAGRRGGRSGANADSSGHVL